MLRLFRFSGTVWLTSPECAGTWQFTNSGWNSGLTTQICSHQNPKFLLTSEVAFFRAPSLTSLLQCNFHKSPHQPQAKRKCRCSSHLAFSHYWLFLLFRQSNIVTNISHSWFPLDHHHISINGCQWHKQQEKYFTENSLLCLWLSE